MEHDDDSGDFAGLCILLGLQGICWLAIGLLLGKAIWGAP